MSDRVAVYAGTRNLYPAMYTALKSLLINTEMDRVYLLIEDDVFPYPVPGNVAVANVSNQEFFSKGGPNYGNIWSYMAMMRCALSQMLPFEEKVLWLDCDTIVDEDIGELFAIDMDGFYYAGAMEPQKSRDVFRYINSGVLLCNLDLLRNTKKDLEIISFLNTYQLHWADQEAINLLCQGRIRIIEPIFNQNGYTLPCIRPKIIHYAAVQDFKEQWAYKKYEQMDMPGLKDDSNDD